MDRRRDGRFGEDGIRAEYFRMDGWHHMFRGSDRIEGKGVSLPQDRPECTGEARTHERPMDGDGSGQVAGLVARLRGKTGTPARFFLVYALVGVGIMASVLAWYLRGGDAGEVASGKAVRTVHDDMSMQELVKAAGQGSGEAMFRLGVNCYYGKGVPVDKAKAVGWWGKAAEQGMARAQFCLGVCYAKGDGVPLDRRMAAEWYRKAAEQGLAEAQYNFGNACYYGRGVLVDKIRGAEWWWEAAERGLARAQFRIGMCCERGEVVLINRAEAVKWYRKAAEQGLAEAQYRLGTCYERGFGVLIDAGKAVELYAKAADQGLAEARERLLKFRVFSRP